MEKYKINRGKLRIADGVTQVDESFMYEITSRYSIRELYIPDSVVEITPGFLWGMNHIYKIVVSKDNPRYDSRGKCNAIIETSTNKLIQGCVETRIPDDVVEIEDKAFLQINAYVIIPDGVKTIGEYAFHHNLVLGSLLSYELPEGLEEIFASAFSSCTALSEVCLPDSVKYIGVYAFEGCTGLKKIVLPNAIDTIEEGVFEGCTSLQEISIPKSIKSIRSYAFKDCTSLSEIEIPNSVISIGSHVFAGCKNIKKIYIPESVRDIKPDSFAEWMEVEISPENPVYKKCGNAIVDMSTNKLIYAGGTLNIPDNVSIIGEDVYKNYSELEEIIIPSSVTMIERRAFAGCYNVSKVIIPASVSSIGAGAFIGCRGLKVDPGNPVYDSRNNCNAIIETASNTVIAGCTGTVFSELIEYIGAGAFYKSTDLKDVIIPESVKAIGKSAFRACDNLSSVKISGSITTIEDYTFAFCSNLEKVVIPESVTVIGESAFYRCANLSEIKIPESVTVIGKSAFNGCVNLSEIKIPESVTVIEYGALKGCGRVILPDSEFALSLDAFGVELVEIERDGVVVEYWIDEDFSSVPQLLVPKNRYEHYKGLLPECMHEYLEVI